jgi:hypothetical protein
MSKDRQERYGTAAGRRTNEDDNIPEPLRANVFYLVVSKALHSDHSNFRKKKRLKGTTSHYSWCADSITCVSQKRLIQLA